MFRNVETDYIYACLFYFCIVIMKIQLPYLQPIFSAPHLKIIHFRFAYKIASSFKCYYEEKIRVRLLSRNVEYIDLTDFSVSSNTCVRFVSLVNIGWDNDLSHIQHRATIFNSSPPIAAYMRQWIRSALIQIMACRLFGAKPLSSPMLGCCQLDPWEQTSVKF